MRGRAAHTGLKSSHRHVPRARAHQGARSARYRHTAHHRPQATEADNSGDFDTGAAMGAAPSSSPRRVKTIACWCATFASRHTHRSRPTPRKYRKPVCFPRSQGADHLRHRRGHQLQRGPAAGQERVAGQVRPTHSVFLRLLASACTAARLTEPRLCSAPPQHDDAEEAGGKGLGAAGWRREGDHIASDTGRLGVRVAAQDGRGDRAVPIFLQRQ
eukprot:2742251-Prymnesium_polylepis.1